MRALLLLAVLIPALATAQTPGSCAVGTAQRELATPDLQAQLFNTGSLFLGPSTTQGNGYIVPRSQNVSPVFAMLLWASGTVGGEMRAAGAWYSPAAFWPGPLGPGATLPDPADCSPYDRIWLVSPADVAAYEAGTSAAADLASWPVGLGAPAVTASGTRVAVPSRAQTLDLDAGERPLLGGGPTAFWVMNDVGNTYRPGAEPPLGIEVQVSAFAPESGPLAARQSTQYRFSFVNRNAAPIVGFRAGLFVDTDLGYAGDDFVGADTTRGMAYTYNAAPSDALYGIPPAVGIDFLGGLRASSHFHNGGPPRTMDPPRTPAQFDARLSGLATDGSPIRALGDGVGMDQGAVVRYSFPGDPVTGTAWSEVNNGQPTASVNGSSDRRMMAAAPAVTLAPGVPHDVDVAVLFAQGTSNLNSVTALRAASDVVQAAYDARGFFPTAGDVPSALAEALVLGAPQPNPARGEVTLATAFEGPATLRVVDVLGRTVLAQPLAAGTRDVRLKTQRLVPGVYALVLDAGAARATRTVTVVR